MNLTKKLIAALMLALFVSTQYLSAVTVVWTVAAGTAWNATNFVNKAATINSISISTGTSGGATNLVFALIDFPGFNAANGWGNIKYTNAAYPIVSSYLTNITKITTNFGSGDGAGNYVTYTNTFTNAVYTYTNTVGQTSNDWRRVVYNTVGSNTTTTFTGPFPFIYGIGFTNNNVGKDLTLTVDYNPAL